MSIKEVAISDLPCPGSAYFTYMDSVLDVGSAYAPQHYVPYGHCTCLEPHEVYIDLLRRDYGADPRVTIYHKTWQQFYPTLGPKSFDCVTAFDVIEHMTKADGLQFLMQAEVVARKQIILNTPLGFYPQNYDDPSLLIGGRPGLHWQTHLSGWQPEDFGEDWTVLFARDVYHNDGNGNPGNYGMLWAFWEKQ